MNQQQYIPRQIAAKRRVVQWLFTLLTVAVPFLHVGGESLLRFDAASRTLLILGGKLRIEEFYLVLITVLILLFGFFLVTMVLGRVWCGWLCPQSTLNDLAQWLDTRIGGRWGQKMKWSLRQLGYLLLSLGIAANLSWYFIPPAAFLRRMGEGALGPVAGTALATVALVIYLDLALVGRQFCKSLCPYGRIQLLTMDRNTLTLEFDRRQSSRCLDCGACSRVCPMGIDIREGLQIECINCGRCVDACAAVQGRRGQPGLIHYSFGDKSRGGGRPLNGRTILLAALVMILCSIFVLAVAMRPEATLKLQRGGNGEVRSTRNGARVAFYTAYLENRSDLPGSFTLRLEGVSGTELVGPVRHLDIAPNENRRVDFAVRFALSIPPQKLRLRLERDGKSVADAFLPPITGADPGR